MARIRDNNGVWFVTDEVSGLTLSRPNSSVKLYKPANVPQDYWVKQYQESASSAFSIPAGDNLSNATGAIFIVRSWNGINGGATSPNTDMSIRVNDKWTAPSFGNDHYYSLDVLSIPSSALVNGTNQVTAYCNSFVHGVELPWPGPAVMVRYSAASANQPPTITQQPTDQTVGVGETATFTVSATGSPAPTYQWQKNTVDITLNGNSPTYTTPPVVKADSGAGYRCIVSNSEGDATSNTAHLIVSTTAPTVTTQPVNQEVGEGETATFTISATGSTPLQYQWQKNGSNILTNGNASSYTTPAVVKADSGSGYRCIVTNNAGADTSHVAYLIVGTFPPSITSEPVSRTVRLGQTATFSVSATGTAPLTYKWQKNGVDIDGAAGDSYTTPATVQADSGSLFRCIVSNAAGHDTSTSAVLRVSSDIQNIVANGGFETGLDPWAFFSNGSGTFQTDVAGPTSPHAAHIVLSQEGTNVQLNQTAIVLDQDTLYTLRFRAYSSSGHDVSVSIRKNTDPYTSYGLLDAVFDLTTSWADYSVQFTASGFTGTETDGRLMFWMAPYDANGDEYYFDDVLLVPSSLLALPVIQNHPAPLTVKEGETATFSVTASGVTPLSYQWQKNQVAIQGATLASYTTPATTTGDNGAEYRCVVTNLGGSVTSNPAVLTVQPLTSTNPPGPEIPARYFLAQNYPNPFNPSTVIRFGLPASGYVTLKVVNMLGQEVESLVSEFMAAGVHRVTFAPEKLPTGMYLYRLQSGSYTETRKLVLVR